MRLVFMGTPEFAVPSLEACVDSGHQVLLAVTQPTKRRGRGQRRSACPVCCRANELGIPVLETARVNDAEHVQRLRELQPDLLCVTAFGQILSTEVLDLPARGCVNVHASLLPRWRGASPIHRALLAGDEVTGVTTMFMVKEMDAGDLILQREVPILPEHDQIALAKVLSHVGGQLLRETLELFAAGGQVPRTPQDESLVTYAPLLTKEEGHVVWSRPATDLFNQIRGMTPWPCASTVVGNCRLKLWKARPLAQRESKKGRPGELVEIVGEGIVVKTGQGDLLLTEVQPANKRRMPAADWARGARLQPGIVLGSERVAARSE